MPLGSRAGGGGHRCAAVVGDLLVEREEEEEENEMADVQLQCHSEVGRQEVAAEPEEEEERDRRVRRKEDLGYNCVLVWA